MTEKLYYTDAYTTVFGAHVVERFVIDGHMVVVLDQSFFYPNSGGQPADHGTLNDVPVIDVTVRREDGAVLHHLAAEAFTADDVQGEINWQRRFNHMQHHTGQHILSRAFINMTDAETVSFHLSNDSVTIDVNRVDLSRDDLIAVEQAANAVVWGNRPVLVSFVDAAEAQSLPLRKKPPVKEGQPLRLINVQEFDLTACGGTHVAYTGEVGVIKIVKQERRGEKTRIEFACGGRALTDYDRKNVTIQELMGELTTGQDKLLNSIQKFRNELREAKKTIKQQRTTLQRYEVNELLQNAELIADTRIVAHVFTDKTIGELKALVNQLTSESGVIVLAALSGEKGMLMFKRSADVSWEMNTLLREMLQQLGSRAGGGTADMAQGGGFSAEPAELRQLLQAAQASLLR